MMCDNTSSAPVRLSLSALAMTLALGMIGASCTDSSPDDPTPNAGAECGEGRTMELEPGVPTCVYGGNLLVETGFQCPPETPFMFEVEGWAVCHGDAELPDDAPELILGELGTACDVDDSCDAATPIRLLMVVDQSLSLDVADPSARRVNALLDLAAETLMMPDAAVAVVGFSAHATLYTGSETETAFSRNPGAVNNAISELAITETATNWDAALETTDSILANESDLIDPAPRFITIWVTDGMPDPPNQGSVPDYAAEVAGLVANLSESGSTLAFNTVYLENNAPTGPEQLLGAMAEAGNGQAQSFGPDDVMDFHFVLDGLQ